MWLHKLPPLFLALLITGVLAACKAPTAPQSGPTLTLILPDSARVFDTVTLRAHYSDSLKTGWKFEWQFGDSSHATTADTSVTHVYDSAGTYSIQVTLVDSEGKTIAKQTGKVDVLPNHFNLSRLQNFSFVTIQCYGFYKATWDGQYECVYFDDSENRSDSLITSFSNLSWTKFGTVQNSGPDTTGVFDFYATRTSLNCTLDSTSTMILSINGDQFYHGWDTEYFNIGNGSEIDFSDSNIYFKSSSDTDMVFEAVGISKAYASHWWATQEYERCREWQEGSGKIDFSNVSVPRKIVIRFHN